MAFFKVGRFSKSFFKTFLNIPAWLGLEDLTRQTVGTYKFLRPVYRAVKPKRQENFEQALQRLHLTEAGLQKRRSNLQWQMYLFGVFTLLVLGYAVFLLSTANIGPGVLAILVALLFVIKLFYCKLWIFQIDHRKLGCSWREVLGGQPAREK